MKRFWVACFAVAATTITVGNVNAQWNQSPEIGSYQSILARTGYGGSPAGGTAGTVPGSLPGHLVNVEPQAVAPVSPIGSSTRQSAGSTTHQPAGSDSREVAPVTSYAPQTSYVPQASCVPQAGASCNGNCGGGAAFGAATPCSSGNCGGGVASYTDLGANHGASSYGAPVYTPGANIGNIVDSAPNSDTINRVGGIFGVVLRRNYADPVRIGSSGGRDIFSDDIDHGDFSGLGVSLAARKANGNGREFVYWGLDDDSTFNFGFTPATDFFSIGQLEDVQLFGQSGAQSAFSFFNNVNNLSVVRDTEINNIEANLLRNGGNYNTRHGKSGNFELLGGLRLFQFDESLSILGGTAAGSAEYLLETENFLIGAQLGARNEVSLTKRLRLATGINVGLFNNRSETRQRLFDQDGNFATVVGGTAPGHDVDYSDTQDDIAIMGEFKVGLIMQVSERFRGNIGYRALGVGGVALAEDQIPLNITDSGLLQRSNTNGSLLLHGVYFGAEACF